ncbi:MAG: aspartate-semialdehyde dehydrogenase [Deltaproteobacteria bacterium]|nr:aspartate-semialdehyde dehydrogenase [Deltaproteobacteria bacterium]
MQRVCFVGWRGMVGSVLMDRMRTEGDFNGFDALFASTSQAGEPGPELGPDVDIKTPPLKDAYDIDMLFGVDIIVTCQGSDYTKKVHPELRKRGWKGYWIDAASALRMSDSSIIVLDPVNRPVIDNALDSGIRDFIGGNCTVSLMLMAIGGLFQQGLVKWLTSMTYQSASGAGAKNMRELVSQMKAIGDASVDLLEDKNVSIHRIDTRVIETMRSKSFPTDRFGVPLAGSVIPWIDSPMESGQTREEWKGVSETNKILDTKEQIPIDGTCVRIGAMRCHSQALTIRLTRNVPMDEIVSIIQSANKWVRIVPNNQPETARDLTPAAVTGTLSVPVGRLRKLNMGNDFLSAFTVGDQLLWGAAEPVRRMLKILLDYLTAS